jgi:hypothetical protein
MVKQATKRTKTKAAATAKSNGTALAKRVEELEASTQFLQELFCREIELERDRRGHVLRHQQAVMAHKASLPRRLHYWGKFIGERLVFETDAVSARWEIVQAWLKWASGTDVAVTKPTPPVPELSDDEKLSRVMSGGTLRPRAEVSEHEKQVLAVEEKRERLANAVRRVPADDMLDTSEVESAIDRLADERPGVAHSLVRAGKKAWTKTKGLTGVAVREEYRNPLGAVGVYTEHRVSVTSGNVIGVK